MRNGLVFVLLMLLISSCARMPYEQWSSSLDKEEATLKAQKLEVEVLHDPNQRLLNGVIKATRKKDAAPYPKLTLMVSESELTVSELNVSSDLALQRLETYRTKMEENSISTLGPEFTDYKTILSSLTEQASQNREFIKTIIAKNQLFDSLCNAYDIREVTPMKVEVDLPKKLALIQDRLALAVEQYDALRRGITSQEDQKTSMTKLNDMRQKLRQVEDELASYSNLTDRAQKRFKETKSYEGPFIDSDVEINQSLEVEARLTRFLEELELMVKQY